MTDMTVEGGAFLGAVSFLGHFNDLPTLVSVARCGVRSAGCRF